MKASRFVFAFVLLLAVPESPARAGFDEGELAFRRGDYAAALKEFAPLAKGGDAKAQYYIGRMLQHGYGVKMDFVKSAEWLHRSAKQGYVHAQYELGMLFQKIAITESEYAKALKWLGTAAKRGHLLAQYALGEMYRDGNGVEIDNVRALALFIIAGEKLKTARSARNQLAKRMTKKEVDRAKKMGEDVFGGPVETKAYAGADEENVEIKGKCGGAGYNLSVVSQELSRRAAEVESCLGAGWTGGLCSEEVKKIDEIYQDFRKQVKNLKASC